MAIGSNWTLTGFKREKLSTEVGKAFGWTFFEHPTKGDEAPLLAYRDGHGVWNTYDYDIPDYL